MKNKLMGALMVGFMLLAGAAQAQQGNGKAVGKPERVRIMQEQKRAEHNRRKVTSHTSKPEKAHSDDREGVKKTETKVYPKRQVDQPQGDPARPHSLKHKSSAMKKEKPYEQSKN